MILWLGTLVPTVKLATNYYVSYIRLRFRDQRIDNFLFFIFGWFD